VIGAFPLQASKKSICIKTHLQTASKTTTTHTQTQMMLVEKKLLAREARQLAATNSTSSTPSTTTTSLSVILPAVIVPSAFLIAVLAYLYRLSHAHKSYLKDIDNKAEGCIAHHHSLTNSTCSELSRMISNDYDKGFKCENCLKHFEASTYAEVASSSSSSSSSSLSSSEHANRSGMAESTKLHHCYICHIDFCHACSLSTKKARHLSQKITYNYGMGYAAKPLNQLPGGKLHAHKHKYVSALDEERELMHHNAIPKHMQVNTHADTGTSGSSSNVGKVAPSG